MYKKIVIISTLILLAIGAYFVFSNLYVGAVRGELTVDTAGRDTNNKAEFSPFGEPTCTPGDEIEYFYYEEKSKDTQPNNKFGLYVYAENKDFIKLADELVNSNGGDWGYAHIPYNVDDRDYEKWQTVFSILLDKHLIPIIQLYDHDDNNFESELEGAADFLDEFVWPVKQRYISVYNEPNDAKFWYGRVDPAEYAQVLAYAITEFKDENEDFFMMNGALNISAANGEGYMDAFAFMSAMDAEVPGIFSRLDGWASHPYPQPNFSGSPYAEGRWSIRAYEDELAYLKNTLGVTKELPVFITETGWAHAEGEIYNSSFYTAEQIADYMVIAFEEVWLPDERVAAVTPFTIWYEPPFDHFSWVTKDNVPYAHYEAVKSLEKIAGNPQKLLKGIIARAPGCTND